MSRIDSFVNISPSYTCIQESFCICNFSRESNFLVRGLLFDRSINLFISSLIMLHGEKMSSIYLLQVSGDENVGKKNNKKTAFFSIAAFCV